MITAQSIAFRAAFVGKRLLDHHLCDQEEPEGPLEKPPLAKELVEICASFESTRPIQKEEIEAAYNNFVDSTISSATPDSAANRLYLAGRPAKTAADDLMAEVVTSLGGAIQRTYEVAILRTAEAIIQEHVKTLKRKRSQLLLPDDYGIPDDHKWREEIAYFLDHIIVPRIGKDLNESALRAVAELVDRITAEAASEDESSTSGVVAQLSPAEFECYCADVLRGNGWKTRLTKASGDQGVDIVAERGGITMVVQCKKYSTPVGNGAVQEVHSGKGFLGADLAVVVSNTAFTPSARELASILGVILIHDSELVEFDKVLLSYFRRQES